MRKLAHADVVLMNPRARRNINLGEAYDLPEFFDRRTSFDVDGCHFMTFADALGSNDILGSQHSFFHRGDRHNDVINSIETQHVLLL
jgi:hypothetical protein